MSVDQLDAQQLGAWIETIHPQAATGPLAEAYATQQSALGHVTPLTQLGSLYPDLVAQRLRLYGVVNATPSAIPDWARRAVALLTSTINRCPFCTAGHVAGLTEAGLGELAQAIVADPDGARSGDVRVDALLDYTRVLTRAPAAVSQHDVAVLRAHGWTDLDILDINNLSAYYSYINRVASGLGLQAVG